MPFIYRLILAIRERKQLTIFQLPSVYH